QDERSDRGARGVVRKQGAVLLLVSGVEWVAEHVLGQDGQEAGVVAMGPLAEIERRAEQLRFELLQRAAVLEEAEGALQIAGAGAQVQQAPVQPLHRGGLGIRLRPALGGADLLGLVEHRGFWAQAEESPPRWEIRKIDAEQDALLQYLDAGPVGP